MKGFVRRYLLPPAAWDFLSAAHRRVAAGQQAEAEHDRLQHWNGEDIAAPGEAAAFSATDTDGPFAVTITCETRLARRCRSGAKLHVPVSDHPPSYLEIGVCATGEVPVRDVQVQVNGHQVARLQGTLSATRWTSLRLDTPPAGAEITLSFQGEGCIWCSRPIVGRNRSSSSQRNVVIVIADSLRPDDVGLYGKGESPSRTPRTDNFFREGLVFQNAYSQGEWTLPSLASMMSGTYAVQHGVYVPYAGGRALPPVDLLAEAFARHGYRTYASSGARRFTPAYGHYRGFDSFRFATPAAKGPICEEEVLRAVEFMEVHRDEPFFCFLHFFDPHEPFARPSYYSDVKSAPERWSDVHELIADYRARGAGSGKTGAVDLRGHIAALRSIRDAMVERLDLRLSSLFAYLEDSGLLDTTTIILTSDHGREDAPGFHQPSLDPSRPPLLTRQRASVPLLILDRRHPGSEVAAFAEAGIDLMPTALRAAGLEVPAQAAGVDLLGEERDRRDCAISESLYRGVYELTIRDADWCYFARSAMDEVSGEISWDNVDERLYAAPDRSYGIADNKIADQPEALRNFRDRAARHIGRARYFG